MPPPCRPQPCPLAAWPLTCGQSACHIGSVSISWHILGVDVRAHALASRAAVIVSGGAGFFTSRSLGNPAPLIVRGRDGVGVSTWTPALRSRVVSVPEVMPVVGSMLRRGGPVASTSAHRRCHIGELAGDVDRRSRRRWLVVKSHPGSR